MFCPLRTKGSTGRYPSLWIWVWNYCYGILKGASSIKNTDLELICQGGQLSSTIHKLILDKAFYQTAPLFLLVKCCNNRSSSRALWSLNLEKGHTRNLAWHLAYSTLPGTLLLKLKFDLCLFVARPTLEGSQEGAWEMARGGEYLLLLRRTWVQSSALTW